MSTSSMQTWPLVGLSRPPTMLKKVLLPEPLGPMMETYSPAYMSMVTPRRASTCSSPLV